jgi:cell division protein FtsQ
MRFAHALHQAALPSDVRWMNALSGALIGLLGLGLLASAVAWVTHRPYFALAGIVVEGDVGRTSVATIRANVAPRLVGNFFSINLQTAQDAFETVPWVRQAALKRVWPNRLEVRLQEHHAAALWSQEGEAAPDKLVNTYGDVFEVNLGDVEEEPLPLLAGPAGSSRHMLEMLQRLREALAPLQASPDKLSLSSRGSWRVVMSNGVNLELGRGSDDEVVVRATQFVATLPEVVKHFDRPLVSADLRHRDAYVVRLKGVTTALAADDKDKPHRRR